jgi:hypothetical protein
LHQQPAQEAGEHTQQRDEIFLNDDETLFKVEGVRFVPFVMRFSEFLLQCFFLSVAMFSTAAGFRRSFVPGRFILSRALSMSAAGGVKSMNIQDFGKILASESRKVFIGFRSLSMF